MLVTSTTVLPPGQDYRLTAASNPPPLGRGWRGLGAMHAQLQAAPALSPGEFAAANRQSAIASLSITHLIARPHRFKHWWLPICDMRREGLHVHVPVIDCSGLFSAVSWPAPRVVEEIKLACREWGFFQIINTGIPQDVVQQHFQLAAGCVIARTDAAASLQTCLYCTAGIETKGHCFGLPSPECCSRVFCLQLLHWSG